MVLGGFILLVLFFLLFDLLVVGRKKHVLSFPEALAWTLLWVCLAVGFYFFLLYAGEKIHGISDYPSLIRFQQLYAPYMPLSKNDFYADLLLYRSTIATEYLAGYLMEYTLSMDNIFVIMTLLTSFQVEEKYYKEVLFWGILGAIVLRFIFIFAGAALIARFNWILYVFGIFLLFTGIKMFFKQKEETVQVENHPVVRFLSRFLKLHPSYVEGKFVARINGQLLFTPLFVVLVLIEFTDVVFAFDSIPAIFGITRDPYLVFFSNIFAIIGLRSLFFFLSKIVNMFRFLTYGIAVLLVFIGIKLLFHEGLHGLGFKTAYSLYFILAILAGSIILSMLFPLKKD